jgi:hypothetical protein
MVLDLLKCLDNHECSCGVRHMPNLLLTCIKRKWLHFISVLSHENHNYSFVRCFYLVLTLLLSFVVKHQCTGESGWTPKMAMHACASSDVLVQTLPFAKACLRVDRRSIGSGLPLSNASAVVCNVWTELIELTLARNWTCGLSRNSSLQWLRRE